MNFHAKPPDTRLQATLLCYAPQRACPRPLDAQIEANTNLIWDCLLIENNSY